MENSPDTGGLRPPKITKSYGLKLIIICALVLLMAIPAMFIGAISYDRSNRADKVVREVSQTYGGQQSVSGPILAVPYEQLNTLGQLHRTGYYIVFGQDGAASFDDIKTEIRKRSLFRVPIFTAKGELSARFEDPMGVVPDEALKLQWDRAKILVAVSDVRGLNDDITLRLSDGTTRRFEPASLDRKPSLNTKGLRVSESFAHTRLPGLDRVQYLSVGVGDLIAAGKNLDVSAKIAIGGAQRFGVTPYAQSTRVTMASDWADPGFQGKFPPSDREISEAGFSANWTVPYLRRGLSAHGTSYMLDQLFYEDAAMAVQFVATDNPYQTVNRALKYSVLFIGMVFLAYFLFEVIVGVPVHPAQYILIGLAQSIFYLLLLAFAERIGFTGAFAISASATIAATAGYAGAVFGGREYIAKAALAFGLIYGLLYILMRLQDFALMVGALASFVAIAGTMYATRNIDWYGGKSAP